MRPSVHVYNVRRPPVLTALGRAPPIRYHGAMTDPDFDAEERPSKSQRKREAHALKALGERLVELPENELATLGLPEELVQAVREARRINAREGRRRQLQYIGRLMRETETEVVRRHFEERDLRKRREDQRFHALEHWRERLIEEGDEALTALLDQYPGADRQRLRTLIRNAQRERGAESTQRATKASRQLFRYLRELDANGGDPA